MNRSYAHFASIAFCAVLFIAGQHNAKAAETPFDDIAIPDSVMASIDAARAGKPLWTPKFKKISYTTKPTSSSGVKYSNATIEIESLPNGLLNIRQIYGDNFDIQQTMLGNFILLKYHSDIPSGDQVLIANKLDLELPAELTLGAKIISESEMEFRPQQASSVNVQMALQCVVQERIDASTLFPKLTGKAAKLDCHSGINKKTMMDKLTMMYLEDLGLFFPQEYQTSTESLSYAISRMDIER